MHDANPLLYTLPQEHMIIQPYWIVIVELIVKQIIANRVWNRIHHKTWATTQELAIGRIVLRLQIAYLEAGKSALEASYRAAQRHQSAATRKSPTLTQTAINFFKDTFTSPQSLLDRATSAGIRVFSGLRRDIYMNWIMISNEKRKKLNAQKRS